MERIRNGYKISSLNLMRKTPYPMNTGCSFLEDSTTEDLK